MENNLTKGWIEIELKELVSYRKGKKPKTLSPVEFKNSVPYLNIKAVEKNVVDEYADSETSNISSGDEIFVVWDGARSGWVAKGMKGAIGSTLMTLKPYLLNTDYLFRFLQTQFDKINSNPRGTGIPHVDPELFWNIQAPLAPLAEQHRIVAKLDTLLARVVNCKNRLEKIPALLKNFRQSVLAALNVVENEFELSHICDLDVGYAFKSVEFENSGIRLLRGENMEPGKLRWIDTKFFPPKKIEQLKHLFLNEDDIVLAMDRPIISTGLKIAQVRREDLPCVLVQRVCRFRPKANLDSNYLYLQLNSLRFIEHLANNQTGTQIPHISAKQIMSFKISLPTIEEQKEIVRKVEELFHFADSIEARYQKAKAWFDKIPQAILAKAFHGELVEQDGNDEPATVLLERIKTLRQAQGDKKQTKKAKPKHPSTSSMERGGGEAYEENEGVSLTAEE